MTATKVKDLMAANPALIAPDATLQEAARKMQELDCGFLPVGSAGKAEGILTDRDIIIRAVAEGKNPAQEKVRDYMTKEVCACEEGDTLEDAAEIMNENSVSRLVVRDGSGKISGVLTFGRIIRSNDNREETSTVVDCATGQAA